MIYFQSAYVVPDIDDAMHELSEALGLTFTEVREHRHGLDGQWPVKVAFTRQGPPFLKLVQGPSGSPWHAEGEGHLDHLGFWADDLRKEVERLQGADFAMKYDGEKVAGVASALLSSPSGLRVELLSSSYRPGFQDKWGITG